MLNTSEQIIVGIMINESLIPSDKIFQITETHLSFFIKTYGEMFGKSTSGTKTKTNTRFARKLAGLTLLKVNFERKASYNDIKAGLVYIIENEIYPDHYKLGMTIELESRLNTYQTYDPFRRFKIVKYDFVLDRFLTEKKLLGHPNIIREQGEWIKKQSAIEIFENICF